MLSAMKIFSGPGLGKMKREPAPNQGQEQGTPTMDQLSQWFLDQALEFERSKREAERKSKTVAWRVAIGALIIAGLAVVAAGVNMFVNKPNPPVVWSHNSVTGEVVQLRALSNGKVDLGKATDLYYLRQYIQYRESYDWETLQDFYDATVELSSPEEAKRYKKLMNPDPTNAKSPVNQYKNNYRVIAKAGTISYIGDVALVSYEKKFIPLTNEGNEKPHVEYFQATIAREYEDAPKTDRDRGINVPGFKVTSFTPERDVTKAAAAETANPGEVSP